MNNLFPIGTVVRVGIGEDLLMIITRLPLTIKDGQKGYYDYGACLYPTGVEANDDPYLFNHEDIAELLFIGYSNAQEEKLQEYIKQKIPGITYPKFNIND